MSMMVLLLCMGVLIAAAGLGAVVWAARGGPRWVHGVAKATSVAAELAASATKMSRRGGGNGNGNNAD
ncbi:hypothetical protein [Streptomyces alboniger]|uniref:Uncharacterized protein n=1 Tax=Streptomyces alboniger TaxID=132473 RepID=A0A5J6HLG1_STRAD|nr:hypothetical protein [Streptomyces alboniger]QEV19190.1 hypothetical protein CP975_18315 [Streptomyces alboniger]